MGLKFNTSWQVKHHCAEGRCKHEIYKNFLHCRKFNELCRQGKNPTMCSFYDHTLDYKK